MLAESTWLVRGRNEAGVESSIATWAKAEDAAAVGITDLDCQRSEPHTLVAVQAVTIPKYPFAKDITKPGLYLFLYHGRHAADQEMPDWGFDGPLIGPLRYVHGTYMSTMRYAFEDTATDEEIAALGLQREENWVDFDSDCIAFGGHLYGDWTLSIITP